MVPFIDHLIMELKAQFFRTKMKGFVIVAAVMMSKTMIHSSGQKCRQSSPSDIIVRPNFSRGVGAVGILPEYRDMQIFMSLLVILTLDIDIFTYTISLLV